jgi:hypothetical protein
MFAFIFLFPAQGLLILVKKNGILLKVKFILWICPDLYIFVRHSKSEYNG